MKKMNIKNEKIIAVLAALTLIILASSTYKPQLLVWYLTQNGHAAGGASAGTGAIVATGIAKSSLTGLALLSAVAG
ncbi:MAG: hypothetical protein QXS51_02795 [Thermoproteota archaeon]|nr:hypothetical protein [Candidatus Brockarchaeota archaeon]